MDTGEGIVVDTAQPLVIKRQRILAKERGKESLDARAFQHLQGQKAEKT